MASASFQLEEVAGSLTPNQRALLADLCDCPGLFAGQYTHDGAGIEHLPSELWQRGYKGGAYAMLGLAHAYPTNLGTAVNDLVSS